MLIYCCGCNKEVNARLTNGLEIYPHRSHLYALPFWVCDHCGNYVGCHHKTKEQTRPLGNIPTPKLRNARKEIHSVLDRKWKNNKERKAIYKKLSDRIGWKYHTANIRSIEEARHIYKLLREL